MRTLGMMTHSYALRVLYTGIYPPSAMLHSSSIVYPPKRHEYGESKEPCSLLKSCFMNRAPTDIFSIKMHTYNPMFVSTLCNSTGS